MLCYGTRPTVRDRIDQGQFRVLFVPGKNNKNLADCFTKTLPVARHKVLAPFFAVVDDDSTDSIDLRFKAIYYSFCCFVLFTLVC